MALNCGEDIVCPIDKCQDWTKILHFRKTNLNGFRKTSGKQDIYLIAPCGKKLRSTYDLCVYIDDKNIYDLVDPNYVNFEKPSMLGETSKSLMGDTKELVKFVKSQGSYTPKVNRRYVFSKTNTKFTRIQEELTRCYKCKWMDLVKTQPNGCQLCKGCDLFDPVDVLEMWFEKNPYEPMMGEPFLTRLKVQTGLSGADISEWFANALNSQSNGQKEAREEEVEVAPQVDPLLEEEVKVVPQVDPLREEVEVVPQEDPLLVPEGHQKEEEEVIVID